VGTHKEPPELWEDNASCIMMSENPTNRDRSRHVDVHFLRDLVRDGHVKLLKGSGPQHISDSLTKSSPGVGPGLVRTAFEELRVYGRNEDVFLCILC